MRDVHGGVVQRQVLGGPVEHLDAVDPSHPLLGDLEQRQVGLDADHRAGAQVAETGEVETAATPDVDQVGAGEGVHARPWPPR